MEGQKGEPRFSAKDKLSFFFSVVAVGLSIFSLYVSDFRVSDDLRLRMTSLDIEPPAPYDLPLEKRPVVEHQDYYVDVAVINAGNRPAIVIDIGLVVRGIADARTFREFMFTPTTYHDSGVAPLLPFTLPSHELRLLHLKMGSETFIKNKECCSTEMEQHYSGSRLFKIGIAIKAMDSSGMGYDVITDSGNRVRLDQHDIIDVAPAEDRGIISIFER